MLKRFQYKEFIWIDISHPSMEDMGYLKEQFHFHQIVLDELMEPSLKTKVEHYDDYLYLVYGVPIFNFEEKMAEHQEIDFLLTHNHLITVHYSDIEIIQKIIATCETNPAAKINYLEKGPHHLLYAMLEKLFDDMLRQIVHIGDRIKQIEKKMFSGQEREMVEEISMVKRDIINMQIINRPNSKTIDSLFQKGEKFFSKNFRIYLADLQNDNFEIWSSLEHLREILESLEGTNSNIVNTKLNETMKLFTVLAFISIPLIFFTQIFSMNTKYTPILGLKYDFWIIIGIVIIAALSIIGFFKKKKLL